MSEWTPAIVMLAAVFFAGFQVGGMLAYRRWAKNADELQRIEYLGRLYKVKRDD